MGTIHTIKLGGAWPWATSIRVDRNDDPSIDYITRGTCNDGAGFRERILIPGPLWDLLRSGLGMRADAFRCRKCDVLVLGREHGNRVELERLQFCFGCSFWLGKAKLRRDPVEGQRFAVIDGKAYYIERESAGRFGRGFGGAPFEIRFADGRVVKTTNLWSNGDVPDRWRGFLPDNARFVQRRLPLLEESA